MKMVSMKDKELIRQLLLLLGVIIGGLLTIIVIKFL